MNELINILSSDSYPWVILALQQDENIKKLLNNPSFIHFAAQKLGADPSAWTPANLCLIILELDPNEVIFSKPLSDNLKYYIDQGEQIIEKLLATSDLSHLELSDLILCSLFITYRLTITNDYAIIFNIFGNREPSFYDQPALLTIFAIIYGLFSQPDSLLEYLANVKNDLPLSIYQRSVFLSHMILCSPLPIESQINIFKSIILKASRELQIELIKIINVRRPNIAQILAEFFLSNNPDFLPILNKEQLSDKYSSDLTTILKVNTARINAINNAVELCKIANKTDLVDQLIQEAEALTQQIQAQLLAQIALSSKPESDPNIASDKVFQLNNQLTDDASRAIVALNWLEQGQFETAQKLLEPFYNSNLENNPELNLAIALLAAHKKDFSFSYQAAKRAFESFKDKVDTIENHALRSTLASYFQRLGKLFLNISKNADYPYEDAIDCLQLSLQLQADNPQTLSLLSEAYTLINKPELAFQQAILAHALSPQPVTIRALAKAYEAKHDYVKALDYWSKLIGDQESTHIYPGEFEDTDNLIAYALCAFKAHRPAAAIEPLKKAILSDPNNQHYCYYLGKAYLNQYKKNDEQTPHLLEESIKTFLELLQREPHYLEGWKELAIAYSYSGKDQESQEAARKALGLAPTDVSNIIWFCDHAERLSNLQEAFDVLQWAIKLYPELPDLKLKLAQIYRTTGFIDQAKDVLSSLMQENESSPPILLRVAEELLSIDQPLLAQQCLENVRIHQHNLDKDNLHLFHYLLGLANFQAGCLEKAQEELKKALKINDQSQKGLKVYAQVSLNLENLSEAIWALEHLAATTPNDAKVYLQLFDIYRNCGELEKARTIAIQLSKVTNAYNNSLAEFAYNIFDSTLAHQLLSKSQNINYSNVQELASACLKAELYLEEEKHQDALPILQELSNKLKEPDWERDQPINTKARILGLLLRWNNQDKKLISDFKNALELLCSNNPPSISNPFDLQMIAIASLQIFEIQNAIKLMDIYISHQVREPRPFFIQSLLLLTQAELQKLCRFLNVSAHAPGEQSFSSEIQQRYESLLQKAEHLAKAINKEGLIKISSSVRQKVLESNDFSFDQLPLHPYFSNQHSLVLLQQILDNFQSQPEVSLDLIYKLKAILVPNPLWEALIAKCAARLNNVDLAIQALQRALTDWQDEDQWHYWLYQLYKNKGETNNAIKHIEFAAELKPNNHEYRLNKALTYINNNLNIEESFSILEELIDHEPQPIDIYLLLADALLEHNQASKAYQILLKAQQVVNPEDQQIQYQVLQKTAQAAKLSSQFDTAITILETLIGNDPQDKDSYKQLVDLYIKINQPSKAIALADQVLQTDNISLEDLVWYVKQTLRLHYPEKAIEIIKKELKNHPSTSKLYFLLAQAQLFQNNREEALSTLKIATISSAEQEIELQNAAQEFLNLDEPEAVLICLSKIKKGFFNKNPRNPENIALLKSIAYQKLGKIEESWKFLEQASKAENPNIPQILKQTLALYLATNQLHLAEKTLNQLNQLSNQDEEVTYLALQLNEKKGEYDKAYECIFKLKNAPLPIRIKAAELACSLLENALALELLTADEPIENVYHPLQEIQAKLLQTELLIDMGDIQAAHAIYKQLHKLINSRGFTLSASETIRLKSIEGRLLFLEDNADLFRLTIDKEQLSNVALYAALKAFWANEAWEEGIALYEKYISNQSQDILSHVLFAKGLILRAEKFRTCERLAVENHTPGIESVSNSFQEKFSSAIRTAKEKCISIASQPQMQIFPFIEQWWIRGKAAFNEVVYPDDLAQLARISSNPQNLASYFAALGRNKAYDLLSQHSNLPIDCPPEAIYQKALGLLEYNPQESLRLIINNENKLSTLIKDAPLIKYLTANAAYKCSEIHIAQEAIHEALNIWHDEPAWQYLAAQISLALGDQNKALNHLFVVQKLKPNSPIYTLAFAHNCIEQGCNIDQVILALNHILPEIDDNAQAHVLLAKAYKIKEEKEKSLIHYQKALDYLANEDKPLIESAIQEYLILSNELEINPETAIQPVKNLARQITPNDFIWKTIADYYFNNHNPLECYNAAQQVIQQYPTNENIIWFAQLAQKLNKHNEALEVLKESLEENPDNISLHLALAEAYSLLGKQAEARQTLQNATFLSDLTFKDKLHIAQIMLKLQQADLAIQWLEQLRDSLSTANNYEIFQLCLLISQAYQQSGDVPYAIKMADFALTQLPSAADVVDLHKAKLYLSNDEPQQALVFLNRVLDINPENSEAHFLAMQIYHAAGQLELAFQHVPMAAKTSLAAKNVVAELCYNCFDEDLAIQILQTPISANEIEPISDLLHKDCLLTELLIAKHKISEAVQLWQKIKNFLHKIIFNHDENIALRIEALQWRLSSYTEQIQREQKTHNWLDLLPQLKDKNLLQAIALAALDNCAYNIALKASSAILPYHPIEPRFHLTRAQSIIISMEYNELAKSLDVVSHLAPLDQEGNELYKQITQALNYAEENTRDDANKTNIHLWKTRADAVFNQNFELGDLIHWSQQILSSDEAIAYLISALKLKDFQGAVEIAKQYADDSRVCSLFALVTLHSHPIQAEEIAAKALEKGHKSKTWLALQYAIAAKIADYIGNEEAAIHYLDNALSIWDNEPLWHQWKAKLALKVGKMDDARKHLEQMLSLQPQQIQTQLAAAQMYIDFLSEPSKAISILTPLMETLDEESDDSFYAQALMAEALLHSGDKEKALNVYRKVFKFPLAKEPAWQFKISLGLAKAALLNEQPSTAIAVLEDVSHISPEDITLNKTLTEAYIKAKLAQSALQSAQKVLNKDPLNVEILTWYAEKNLELNQPHEALQALSRALEIHPEDPGILLLYANTLLQVGKRPQALEWYQKLLNNDSLLIEDIIHSADILTQHNETDLALNLLQNAQHKKAFYSAEDQRQLLLCFARVYQQIGDLHTGIKYVEQALQLNSEPITEPYKLKASMYLKLNRPQAALAVLDQALAIDPNDESIETQKLEILKAKGEVEAALEQAQKMARRSLSNRALAAAFSIMMMDGDATKAILNEEALDLENITPITFLLAVYKAELALENGETSSAISIYHKLKSTVNSENEFLSSSLKARFIILGVRLSKRGCIDLPITTSLEEAYSIIAHENSDISHKVAFIEAALECFEFDKAKHILDQMLSIERKEPKPFLLSARLLTQKAEYRRLCDIALVKAHAPEADALSEFSYQSFENAINLAVQKIAGNQSTDQFSIKDNHVSIKQENYAYQQILKWWIRGKAVFSDIPDEEILSGLANLPPSSDDTAALISAYARAGKSSLTYSLAKDYPKHPEVQAQWLASLIVGDVEADYFEVKKSVEHLLAEKSNLITPLIFALLARVADKAGDKEEALQMIQEAIHSYENEGLWVEFYANKCFELGNAQNGFTALEKYLTINPSDSEIRRKLAKAYFNYHQFNSSITHYRCLAEESLSDAQSRLAIADAFLAQNKLNEAKHWAEEALAIDNKNKTVLLINATIALKAKDFIKAYKHAKAALHIDSRDENIYLTLAYALHALNQPEKALRALDKAIEFSENPVKAKLEKIKMLRSIQGDEAALPLLFKLSEENPDYSPALAYLAHFLAQLEQSEPALQAAQIALQNDDGLLDENELSSLHLLSGKLYHNDGQLDKAIYHFSQAIKYNPHEVEYYIELGKTYQERRQPQQALQTLRQAIQLFPSDARLYYHAAIALKESKDYNGAEKMLKKAAQLAPNDLRIQRLLGSISALNLVHNR